MYYAAKASHISIITIILSSSLDAIWQPSDSTCFAAPAPPKSPQSVLTVALLFDFPSLHLPSSPRVSFSCLLFVFFCFSSPSHFHNYRTLHLFALILRALPLVFFFCPFGCPNSICAAHATPTADADG